MNLIDAKVTRVVGAPIKKTHLDREWWQVEVDYFDDGGNSKRPTTLVFRTKEEAEKVKPGFTFQH